jgi:hypothetical protein
MNRSGRVLCLVLALAAAAVALPAANIPVTTTADSGAGSLRAAITQANGDAVADVIQFNIPGAGPHTITPASALPNITQPLTIDGYTQPGSSPNTNAVGLGLNTVLMIEIDGTNVPNGFACLNVTASNVTIKGLVINRCSNSGPVQVDGTIYQNFVLEGSFISVNPAGTQALPRSSSSGLRIEGDNARIGGTTPAARNLISHPGAPAITTSSGGENIVIQGNLIGTDITGATIALGMPGSTSARGIQLSSLSPVVGGVDPNAANVIAGGYDISIRVINSAGQSSNALIQGNYIGVDAAMTRTMSNGNIGIQVDGATPTIGGTAPGAGNVIGGHGYGIFVDGGPVTIHGNFIGTDKTGTKNFGNRNYGISISADTVTVGGIGSGEGNTIAFNRWAGVVLDSASDRNPIRGNRFYQNGVGLPAAAPMGIAIDLALTLSSPNGQNRNDLGDVDGGANDFQNPPLITSAMPEGGGTRVIGTLNSIASSTFDLDFYSNAPCRPRPRALLQAEAYIGSIQVTTDASGNASFNQLLPTPIAAGSPVSATATDADGNTSELWSGILFTMSSGFGGPGYTFEQNLNGHLFEPGATIAVGGSPITPVEEVSEFQRRFLGPSLTPGGVYDVTLVNPSGLQGTLENGYVSRFLDTPPTGSGTPFVARLVAGEVTAGCGGGNYCLSSPVTRAQMAIFLLRGNRGACYVPANATGTVFGDVPLGSFADKWIEELAASGVTSGCGGGNYCPESAVTRDQMAVFILRTLEGPGYFPPACVTPTYLDVPCANGFARWIEELSRRGITSGCGGGNYCPTAIVNREQMAVFIAAAFGLR